MSGFTWSNENVFKLIELFQERELLWNNQIDEYKDRTKKHDAWMQIANEFNSDKQSIEKKIRSLIGQFQRETKKSKSNAGADEVPKWFAYKKLLFLKDRNKSEENVDGGLSDTDDESLGNVEVTSQRTETVDTNKVRSSASQPPAPQVCEAPFRKRKLDSINEAINKLYKISSTKNEELDEFDHFGKFLTAQLRKMPEYEAILCQEELHSVIRKYRLRPLAVSLNNASSMSPLERSPTTPSPTQIHIKNEM